MSETTVVIWATQFCLWAAVLILLFRLGTLVGKQSAQLEQMHHNLYFIERRIMSALTDTQAAVAAEGASIDALAARVAALPAAAATEADLAALTASVTANKAKVDAIAPAA